MDDLVKLWLFYLGYYFKFVDDSRNLYSSWLVKLPGFMSGFWAAALFFTSLFVSFAYEDYELGLTLMRLALYTFLPAAILICWLALLIAVAIALLVLTAIIHTLHVLIEEAVNTGLPRGINSFWSWFWTCVVVLFGAVLSLITGLLVALTVLYRVLMNITTQDIPRIIMEQLDN